MTMTYGKCKIHYQNFLDAKIKIVLRTRPLEISGSFLEGACFTWLCWILFEKAIFETVITRTRDHSIFQEHWKNCIINLVLEQSHSLIIVVRALLERTQETIGGTFFIIFCLNLIIHFQFCKFKWAFVISRIYYVFC